MKYLIIIVALFLLCFVNLANAASLDWSDNTELDLAGYKVYRTLTPGNYAEPEAIIGLTSEYPIPDELVTCIYWVVTAFDLEGLESVFSNEVSNCDGVKPAAPGSLIYITDSIVNITVVNPSD